MNLSIGTWYSRPRCNDCGAEVNNPTQFASATEPDTYYCFSHRCIVHGCPNKLTSNIIARYCDEHECTIGDCFLRRKEGIGSTFCGLHNCHVEKCPRERWVRVHPETEAPRISLFCTIHSCKISGCELAKRSYDQEGWCAMHRCTVFKCRELKVEAGKFCGTHTCKSEGCREMVQGDASASDFCERHRCWADGCLEEKKVFLHCKRHSCKKGVFCGPVFVGEFCGLHTCNVDGCFDEAVGFADETGWDSLGPGESADGEVDNSIFLEETRPCEVHLALSE